MHSTGHFRYFSEAKYRPHRYAAVCAIVLSTCWEVRRRREKYLHGLPCLSGLTRSISSLIELSERNCLMGHKNNLLDELESIRRWHRERGFNGGIVLRELHTPLYQKDNPNDAASKDVTTTTNTATTNTTTNATTNTTNTVATLLDEHVQRHCYYIYYEIRGDGHKRQQIFCRGSTVLSDVFTNLQALYVHDEELGCSLHMGFLQHAERMLADLGG